MAIAKQPSRGVVALLCEMIDNDSYAQTSSTVSQRESIMIIDQRRGLHHAHVGSFNAARKAGYLRARPKQEGDPWYATYYAVSDAGRAVAEANRALIAAPEQRELLLTVPVSGRYTSDKIKVGILCEVVRETSRRIYVNVIQDPNNWLHEVVEGNAPNQYVSIDDVARRDISEAQYARMVEVARAHQKWKAEMTAQEEAAIKMALRPFEARRVQKDAEVAAEMQDILGDK